VNEEKMAGVFISYRRDDTAGHAGRLFDSLVRRFGEPSVFMDLTDIDPGSDFVETLERAVGSCDVLLVLIGRNWLHADSQGRSRLEDPQDLLRREVATALTRNIPVLPVLVQGAQMPTADELPQELKALARRQAIELSESRWETDVAHLEEGISRQCNLPRPDKSVPPETGSQRRRLSPRVEIAGVTMAVVIAAFIWRASTRNDGVPTPEPTPTGPAVSQTAGSRAALPVNQQIADLEASRNAATNQLLAELRAKREATGESPKPVNQQIADLEASRNAATNQLLAELRAKLNAAREKSPASTAREPDHSGLAYALSVPAVSKVRVNGQEFQILAMRLEPRGGDSDLLSILVRMTDHSGIGDVFSGDAFRLVLADAPTAPVSGPSLLLGRLAAADGEVRFEIPKSLSRTNLEISRGQQTTRIPVDLRDRKTIPEDGSVDRFGLSEKPRLVDSVARLPLALSINGEVTSVGVTYKVLSASVDRYNVEKAAIIVMVRCTVDKRSYGTAFHTEFIRLVVDGVPRAPDEPVNELVQAGTTKDAAFVFLLERRPDTLKLTMRIDKTIEIPIDMSQIR
jgi:hypothetical protein